MLKIKLIALLASITLVTHGQLINNLSSDRTNIYFHALNSTVKILKAKADFGFVTVYGERSVVQCFSEKVAGIQLKKMVLGTKKVSKIRKGEARLIVGSVQIIRNEFKVSITTWGYTDKLGEGMYIFRYKYIPEAMTYELKEIKTGILS